MLVKFEYCVSNPPYQSSNNAPIFQNFQTIANFISRNSTMIYMASRWWYGTSGLNDFRKNMLLNKHLKNVYYFNEIESSKTIFDGTDISGGVSIVVFSENINSHFTLSENFTQQTVKLQHDDTIYLPIKASKVIIAQKINRKIKEYNLGTLFARKQYISNEIKMTGEQINQLNPIKCDSNNSKNNYIVYANLSGNQGGTSDYYIIKKPEHIIEKHKVCIGQSIIENENRSLRIFRFLSNTTFGRSAVSLAYFDEEAEAINYEKYASSKFFEFTLRLSLSGRMKTFGYYVPDFKSYGNDPMISIDWNKNIDEQLYKFFDLTKDEIQLIENDVWSHK